MICKKCCKEHLTQDYEGEQLYCSNCNYEYPEPEKEMNIND